MSRPDGEQQPHELDQLIASMEATLNELRARRDADLVTTEEARAEDEARRRRAGFYIVPGLAGTILLGRRVLTHPAGAAIASSAATAVIATAATLAITMAHEQAPLAEAPPATSTPTALPPVGGNPPHVGPPKTSPPRTPPTTPPGTSPRPRPTASGDHPSGPPATTAPATPTPPSDAEGDTSASGPGPSQMPTCRIYLPHILRRGLLCGRLAD